MTPTPYSRSNYGPFPPIDPATLSSIADSGLRKELLALIDSTYTSLAAINDTKTFVSAASVIDVLKDLDYDPSDTVFVLSRNDVAHGFWTQARRAQYIEHLRAKFADHGEINQRRVVVYDDANVVLVPRDDIFNDLVSLHAPGTLRTCPRSLLRSSFPALDSLSYGCTISTARMYAVVPTPAPEQTQPAPAGSASLTALLHGSTERDMSAGPMKALVLFEPSYVADLLRDLQGLFSHPRCHTVSDGGTD